MFDQITGRSPNPNFPTLDNELVENISYWKRNLAAELGGVPPIEDYAALFNAIIFTRAAEDHNRRINGLESQILLEKISQQCEAKCTLKEILTSAINDLISGSIPEYIIDLSRLNSFNELNKSVLYDLFLSFYKSRKVPYSYDFAVMSKHALTKIYEKYVALLYFEETNQLSFLPILPKEEYSKRFGSVYTPEFISRFFARYAQNNIALKNFRSMMAIDPACGSGIFLRTLLEFQCAPGFDPLSTEEIKEQFDNIHGIDIDENAIQVATLSLALLHLVLMSGELPDKLNLFTADAIDYFSSHSEYEKYNLVISNPPYIASDNQTEESKNLIRKFLGDLSLGKIDSYLAFIKIAVDLLKPDGLGMFVLPHAFLKNKSTKSIRKYLTDKTWIRCIVDLSEIPVFENQGSYVILLIFQKKNPKDLPVYAPKVDIIVCKDFVGHALSDYLKGLRVNKEYYQIFDLDQKNLQNQEWRLESPLERNVIQKLNRFEPLNKYLDVFQGVVTGNDTIFVLDKDIVKKLEEDIWKPLLPDREMLKYKTPSNVDKYLFYPKINNKLLSQVEIEESYPRTWEYLLKHKDELVKNEENKDWWIPHRLRNQKTLFSIKILTPHLVLLPKFSLDISGKYAVSRSPFLTGKEGFESEDLLNFFLGILKFSY